MLIRPRHVVYVCSISDKFFFVCFGAEARATGLLGMRSGSLSEFTCA
jgi:hypothetical protein